MKKLLLFVAFLSLTAYGQVDRTGYLQKVLRNLEQIETSSFRIHSEAYAPGDTVPHAHDSFYKAFANPADTTLGVKFLKFDAADTSRLLFGYDGFEKASIEYNEKIVLADNFSTLRLPFRPITIPFFNYAENILRYALTTSDQIEIRLDDTDDDVHFRLAINEDRQIEFFGRAYRIPTRPLDPRSVYEIWIRKSDDLPYRIRREMEHDTTDATVSDVSINTLPRTDWHIKDYFPTGFSIHMKGVYKSTPKPSSPILGRQAPAWSLTDAGGKNLSLEDIKSKVVLINFTGIGCGACQMAIPFLNDLTERFKPSDFTLVAIESWGKQLRSIQIYSDHYKLKYPFLEGSKPTIQSYLPSSAVPVFFLLDRQRTVRKIVQGYSRSMNNEITQAIEELIHEAE